MDSKLMLEQTPMTLVYCLLGPLAGFLIGISHAVIAIVVFHSYGSPSDFSYQGLLQGMDDAFILAAIKSAGGACIGVMYGVVLIVLLMSARRRVRPVPILALIILLTTVASLAITIVEFESRVRHDFVHEMSAIFICLIATFGASQPYDKRS